MTDKARLSRRCSMLIIGVYSIAVVVYVSVIIEFNHIHSDEFSNKERQFFLKMKFPFDYDVSPIHEIILFIQFLQLLSNASVIGMLDAFIITLMLHISGQVDIVCYNLCKLFSEKYEHKSYGEAIGMIIRKHQNLIALSNNIENLFTYIALMQFFTNTFVICCIAVVIVTSLESKQGYILLLKSLFFYIAITLEAFIFCFSGEYLSNKMLHIGGQIDIIHQQLDEICPNDEHYDLSSGVARSLVSKHHKIIAFSESIESLFSQIALMQFLSNTMIMCCIGFLVVTTLGTDDGIRMLIKTSFFYIAMTMESFIFCFAGEYLSNKSKTVGDAAYESLWYILKPRDGRILLLMIMRSQRRLTITAGKFMDLSLQGFTNVRFH
ncbi:Putative odorant receptor 22c [Harpegnathos saltator]|uniref:Odorant receptor n=1 Tax=Harpegnathos saltator TaxID=610380 RepID=E2BZM7_HARSA|nr:Putative odorant receptor 22c [Harpegnathos saltator]